MDISVIIPTCGDLTSIVRCLRSLEPFPSCGVEVCVVDDGGGMDESLVRTKLGDGYPLVWRVFPHNRGRSAARNEGIRATGGDLIVFLDDDMEAAPGFLEAHAAAHRGTPHTAVVGAITWPRGGSFLRYIGTRGVAKLAPGDTVPPWYFVTGNASVMRADLPDGAPFDETLPGWGGEDLDLGMRLAAAGVGFRYAPAASARHHFTGTLPGHITRTREYGKHTLPVLINRHPSLEGVLRLDKLRSPWWRAAVSAPPGAAVRVLASAFDRLPVPDAVYDYLTFAAYARGWLEGRDRT